MMQLIFAVFFLVLALKIVGLLLKICGDHFESDRICPVTGLWNGHVWIVHGLWRSVVCVGVSGAGGKDYFIKNPL